MIKVNKLLSFKRIFTGIRYCHSLNVEKIVNKNDTIFALSSGLGKCGVAVIRVSGPDSIKSLQEIAGNYHVKPRTAHLRSLRHPLSGELIDKGLILWFPGPHSFSGEDSCEFQVHGGTAVVQAMLEALSSLPNHRFAEPGEFTKRAFFNGKLDLTEVEGLADLIHAETELQRKQALIQATGNLSKLYQAWREILLKCVAHFEAYIDFAEDENIEDDVLDKIQIELKSLRHEISQHLSDGRKGERLRDGVRTAIIGAPNVGKSSLLNILCQKPVSIVTDIAGTTRDIIEKHLNIGGHPILLADTAGMRKETTDIVESEGITRAKDYLETVDLILMVIDASQMVKSQNPSKFLDNYTEKLGLCPNSLKSKRIIYFLNKTDLISKQEIDEWKFPENVIRISCLTNEGVQDAITQITSHLKDLCGNPSFENPVLSRLRHRHHLTNALEYIDTFLEVDPEKDFVDLAILAENLRIAMRSIGKITGQVGVEDVLDSRALQYTNTYLLFPKNPILQLSMAVVSLVESPDLNNRKVQVNSGWQTNFDLPSSVSVFTNPVNFPGWYKKRSIDENHEIIRKKRKAVYEKYLNGTRIVHDIPAGALYNSFRDMLPMYGFHEECLERSICEMAKHPIHRHEDDVLSEALHILLTPSEHQAFDDNELHDKDYYEKIENLGKHGVDCKKLFYLCKETPLAHLTELIEIEDE
uniref:CSON013193 protein n=1 Tax=Culicoides sonorensis TaxID=179676 RepID=A0A336MBM8_CULSO